MSSFKRALALTFSGLLAGAAIGLAVASPAQATAADCITYLSNMDYGIDAPIRDACNKGDELGGVKGLDYCKGKLKQRGGIAAIHITNACTRAIS